MKVLVVGGSGMLGTDVVSALESRGHEVAAPSSSQLDLRDPVSVAEVASADVSWCVNCAAYTAVDKAESEPSLAFELNALGPGYLARTCALAGIKLLHVSTDFVFDGTSSTPYTEDSPVNPLGAYGRTKREGEEAVLAALPIALIFRTSWLYGPNGSSFPLTMIRAWQAEKKLRVVSDQTGCPTYTFDLAESIVAALEKDLFPGIYHATGPDTMTWHTFARLAIEAYRDVHGPSRVVEVEPIQTSDWPTPARRPAFSVLSNAKLQAEGIAPMRPTVDALQEFVSRLA